MLRARLEKIGETYRGQQHGAKVAELAAEFSHSITIVESAYDILRYSCLMHALRLTGQKQYLRIASQPGSKIFAGTDFAHWLLNRRALTEVAESAAHNGDLVFYFDASGVFQHAGFVRPSGRVESKWGHAPLYEHPTLEVPAFYGDTVRFFKSPSAEAAIELFQTYAKEHGFVPSPGDRYA